jgi:WD40 repeat protein
MTISKKYWLIVIFICLMALPSTAQFYNGHQMTFGKNRVQYNGFYWTFLRFERFDTYYNEHGKALAEYTAGYAEKELDRIENMFDYNLDRRIIFVIYNKLSDFRQSNIGLVTGKAETNIGGVTQIDRNKVFLFFEGDYKKFDEQISAAIAQVLVSEMIYGLDFRQNVTSSTLINLPSWYVDGLIAYISKGWDIETENRVKDGILRGRYKKFNRLVGDDARYAGHSFWRYVSEVYGETVIPSILYLTKINKNANVGFLYVLGAPLKQIARDWNSYYKDLYSNAGTDEIPTEGLLKKKPHKKRVYQQISVNPNGKYIAYVTNQMGQYKIWIHNLETGKRKKILKREHKLEQITDYSYPVLAWHPSGRTLTFITEEEGGLRLYYASFGEKKLQRRNMLYFEKILDFSFSHDGSLIVLSAIKDGKSDIYVHNMAAGTNFQVTNDMANDFDPRFINSSQQIIFSSDRRSDSLSIAASDMKMASARDLFIYNYAKQDDKLMRLPDHKYANQIKPFEVGPNTFISLSDKNGILNRYYSEFDSSLAFVDTTIHYKYVTETKPVTNYSRNILDQDYSSGAGKAAEIIFRNGRYYMYTREPDEEFITPIDDMQVTEFRKALDRKLAEKDSLLQIDIIDIPLDSITENMLITGEDTVNFGLTDIDINNYIFEVERINLYNSQLRDQQINIRIVEEVEKEQQRPRIYQKAFYQNYVVSQIDFSFLSESYQAFTGGAVYFNPGINLLMKVGTHDLFEDYKVTGGFRLPLDFESSEYLLSVENLKGRLDKQLVYHRQTFKNYTGDENTEFVKTITNEISGVFRYPFSQVTSTVFTIGLRSDNNVYLSDQNIGNLPTILEKPNVLKFWGQTKLEYIFDNTRSLGINLPGGTRFKLYGEYYQQLNHNMDYLFVAGADFRHYIVLHRNLILASRFATSSSFGSARLIYYLGGVDNWTNITPLKHPTFIPLSEIRIDPDANYVYQAVATNMRGFSQNIRNGNSFALINTELRWPIISYLANYPLSNSFLQNFQAVGFFDIGTAWSGLTPWSGKNAYDNDIIRQGPVEIEIDADREPIVAGYGFGIRSQLFGYFVRLDWAWGIENMQVLPRIFYLSLSLDF